MILVDRIFFESCMVLDPAGFFLSKNIPPPDPHASAPILISQITIPAPYQCRIYLSLSYKHRYTLVDFVLVYNPDFFLYPYWYGTGIAIRAIRTDKRGSGGETPLKKNTANPGLVDVISSKT
jgi:hypothetical protein